MTEKPKTWPPSATAPDVRNEGEIERIVDAINNHQGVLKPDDPGAMQRLFDRLWRDKETAPRAGD